MAEIVGVLPFREKGPIECGESEVGRLLIWGVRLRVAVLQTYGLVSWVNDE